VSASSLPPLPPELRDRVLAAVEREPVPSRVEGARRRIRAVVLGFGSLLATLAFLGLRAHGRPHGYIGAVFFAWFLVAAVATWAGVGQGRSMLGRPAGWLVAVVALTPVAMLAAWAGVAMAWPTTLHDASGVHQHLVCDVATLGFSIGPLLAFVRLRRGSDPVTPRLTAAAIATAAAAWGAVALHLVCGFTAPVHILLGHVAPVLFVAMAGALLMERRVAVPP
jgi:negative regulator of sigma F NrsF-like protein